MVQLLTTPEPQQHAPAVAPSSDEVADDHVAAPTVIRATGSGRLPAEPQQLLVDMRARRFFVSGGSTKAAKRRQRRTEAELVATNRILITELRERYAERAKVLREEVKRVIAEIRELRDLRQEQRHHRDAQVAAELVRKEERRRDEQASVDAASDRPTVPGVAVPAAAVQPSPATTPSGELAELPVAAIAKELARQEQQYQQAVPIQLEKQGQSPRCELNATARKKRLSNTEP
ncbi:unnamed protein product [Phytophthora fragariaefolia]|uniref:Unnamed protein product n=1 Tax=Phytophthora fragariaefolia TaxID=1490495 RepID=A0A9W6X5I2_9STRA|nr:unnamed protein product [Phytophthora fragariaefolia]